MTKAIEERRFETTHVEKNLLGLSTSFDDVNIHENYLNGLEKKEFLAGL